MESYHYCYHVANVRGKKVCFFVLYRKKLGIFSMQERKFDRSRQHRRKQRLSSSYSNPCAVNSLFHTIRSRLWHLVHFLCAAQVT